MIRHTIELECIGDDTARAIREVARRAPKPLKNFIAFKQRKPWVAEISGTHPVYGFERTFVDGQIDFMQSNGVGSRGIRLIYNLHPYRLYQVNELVTWEKENRYFLVTLKDRVQPVDLATVKSLAIKGGRL